MRTSSSCLDASAWQLFIMAATRPPAAPTFLITPKLSHRIPPTLALPRSEKITSVCQLLRQTQFQKPACLNGMCLLRNLRPFLWKRRNFLLCPLSHLPSFRCWAQILSHKASFLPDDDTRFPGFFFLPCLQLARRVTGDHPEHKAESK